MMRTPYASDGAVEFSDRSMEAVCYYAYWASTELAEERGRYSSFAGSLWDRGILPQDSLKLLADERGGYVEVDMSPRWIGRGCAAYQAARHAQLNCVAIARLRRSRTSSGVDACIEPTFQNLFVKSNLSGEFTVVNEHLVRDLKRLACGTRSWSPTSSTSTARWRRSTRPGRGAQPLCNRVRGRAVLADRMRARRQKWIDQAQSLNIYMRGRPARSSTRPTGWPGCVASRPPTTCGRSARHTPKSRRPPEPVS